MLLYLHDGSYMFRHTQKGTQLLPDDGIVFPKYVGAIV
jgi:hypothetical protein